MLKLSDIGSEIIDTRYSDRPVALVHHNGEAVVIMAYLNGHLDIAARMQEELTQRLDRSH